VAREDPLSVETGDSPAESPLPIEGIGDISLADLLGKSGCPLCRLRRESSERYLRTLLWEGVNDIGFRERLALGRGFCRRHARELLAADRAQSGGSLGAAILLASIARRRLDELRSLPRQGWRARRDLNTLGEPAACPVCAHTALADQMAVDRLLVRLANPTWRRTMQSAELCLEDLVRMWAAASEGRHALWPEVAAAQLARIERLVELLDSFAHHSSHDRRHLLTDTERGAADEAAAFLGGAG
jgi:hypothetical protein